MRGRKETDRIQTETAEEGETWFRFIVTTDSSQDSLRATKRMVSRGVFPAAFSKNKCCHSVQNIDEERVRSIQQLSFIQST